METNKSIPNGIREIHKQCLRLAAHHYTSKEIARRLGISKHTVDQRLRHATLQLGATSRYDAARRFVELERILPSTEQCDQVLYNPPYLSENTVDVRDWASSGERDQLTGTEASKLEDAQAPYNFGDASKIEALFSHTVSSGESLHQPLSLPMKSLLAVAIAAISLVAFGAAVAALEVLSRI